MFDSLFANFTLIPTAVAPSSNAAFEPCPPGGAITGTKTAAFEIPPVLALTVSVAYEYPDPRESISTADTLFEEPVSIKQRAAAPVPSPSISTLGRISYVLVFDNAVVNALLTTIRLYAPI